LIIQIGKFTNSLLRLTGGSYSASADVQGNPILRIDPNGLTFRRAIDGIVSSSILVASCWSLVGCNNAPSPKFSSIEMIQRLSGMQDLSSRCRSAENAEATDCKLVREGLANMGMGNKIFYRTSSGSLVGIDFVGRVVVILEPVTNSANVQWKCSVSPSAAAPAACDVLH
jgi:hypothetical protein